MDRLSTDVGSAAVTDYGARLRRRWRVLLLGLLLGLGAGALALLLQPQQFTSTATVLVAPVDTGSVAIAGGRTNSQINLDTEAQLVRSAQVADAARTLLRTQEPVTSLLDRVSVTVPPNSQVLSVAYVGDSAKGAQEGAHAFAQAYLTNRALEAKNRVDVTVAGLQSQLEAAQEQLRAITDKAAALVEGSPDRVYADAQRTVAINQVNDLTARLAPLQVAPPASGEIITDASLPQEPSAPVPAITMGGGLVLGLLLGLAGATAMDRTDHKLRRPGDVTRQVGLPVLLDVPEEHTPDGALPGDGQAPVFDRLRNTLVGADHDVSVLQVADTSARGASGLVALQLARSLERTSGEATLVLAHPGSALSETLGCSDRPGLAEVLRGDADLTEVRCSVAQLPGVTVIPAGRAPEELEVLLQSPRLTTVLASLRGSSSSVVLETLGTGSAAAQAVAAHSQAVLLVVERGRTDARDVADAVAAARQMGSTVAGVALVPALNGRKRVGPRQGSRAGQPPVDGDWATGARVPEPAASSPGAGWRFSSTSNESAT